jgi:hypothetical protein
MSRSISDRAKSVPIHPFSSLLSRRVKKVPGPDHEAFVRTVPCLRMKVCRRGGTERSIARLEAHAWACGWSSACGRSAHIISVSTFAGNAIFVTDDPEGFVKHMSDLIQVAAIQVS